MHIASTRLEEEFFVSQDIINAGQPVAIVTGGTHGIGRATVSALSQAGWLVALQGRSETEGREIADARGSVMCLATSQKKGPFVALSLARRISAKGRIDELVRADLGIA